MLSFLLSFFFEQGKGLNLRQFVFDVCVCVSFYICVGIDFVDMSGENEVTL